jgi:deoxyribodipyrimidine photo-lyase
MLQGIEEVRQQLLARHIGFLLRRGTPAQLISPLARDAALVVTDRGYLRIQRQWRHDVAQQLNCPLIQVESDVVVPIELAYPKQAYSAAVLRPKIHHYLESFLTPPAPQTPLRDGTAIGADAVASAALLATLALDSSVGPVTTLRGGPLQAEAALESFIATGLDNYALERSDPGANATSHLSPYLHFGHIGAAHIVQRVLQSRAAGSAPFIEELVVRRELAMNFVFYNPRYDFYPGALSGWAAQSLANHEKDPRPALYSRTTLEKGLTEDIYWNAAQRQMRNQGWMHGYMRMYWGKKIIEWSSTPRKGYATMLYLNNKYLVDGRDANGFAGIAWCFGTHDRPWKERAVFGTIRYMNAAGLQRKFAMQRYLAACP